MAVFEGNAAYGHDWQRSKKRWEAWWNCDMYDRPVLRVTAPRRGVDSAYVSEIGYFPTWDTDPKSEFMDFTQMYKRIMNHISQTFYGGEAIPNFDHKWSVGHALAFGCEPEFNKYAAWCHALTQNPGVPLEVDKACSGWKWMMETTKQASLSCGHNYFVRADWGNHSGDILTTLWGNDNTLLKMIDDPELVRTAIDEVTMGLHEIYRGLWDEVAISGNEGFINYIGCWAPEKAICLDCDVSCMISEDMFKFFFVEPIIRTMHEADFRAYHIDGPGALKHLDTILGIKELQAVQWVPGAAHEEIGQWMPLLKHIQQKGKAIWISCEPGEIDSVLRELSPCGLCITTSCPSQDAAERLLESIHV